MEILKTLYRRAEILILDEPTAVLTPQEQEKLFSILRELAQQGKTILLLTHKLHEVMSVSDTVTILRHGRVTANLKTAETSLREICRYMIGRETLLDVQKPPSRVEEIVLAVEKLSVENESGRKVVNAVSFRVRAGEIVGIAGVAGNGQSELIEAITGLRAAAEGRIMLMGQDISSRSVAERRQAGQAYIPEDRNKVGLALQAMVSENLLMSKHRQSRFTRKGFLNLPRIRKYVNRLIADYAIKMNAFRKHFYHLQAPFFAILGAMVIGAVIMLFSGHDPLEAYWAMVRGAFAGRHFSNLYATLGRATPIVGMGLTAAIAFRAGCINLGGEGQLVLGGLTSAFVAIYAPLPGWLLIPASMLAAALVAGVYAWFAAFCQVHFNAPLLLISLLLNYPATLFASYCVTHPFRDVASGMAQTFKIPSAAYLPRVPGTRLHLGMFITFSLVLLLAFILKRSAIIVLLTAP